MDETTAESATGGATPAVRPVPRSRDSGHRADHVPAGIGCMVVATITFSSATAMTKWQVGLYPVGEVVFMRSLASFVTIAAFMLPLTGFSVFATRRPGAHLARSLSQAISQVLFAFAFSMMPLGDAVSINFSAPLFSALISIVWLKERATIARWAALLVGFAGVLIVAHPGAGSLQIGTFLALGNAVMYGSVTVAVRGMTKTESANTLLAWQLTAIAFFHSFLLLFGWRTPTLIDAAMMFGSGLANAIGQYFWTQSLRLAPATAVAPFYYLMLVWALGLGFVVWGDVPSAGLLLGSVIVVVSGLVLYWREARMQRAVALAARKAAG